MWASSTEARCRRITASGFTLIEAAVALAILALTLTVVYQSYGWALRHGAEQKQREWALLTAQSLLDQVHAENAPTVGRRTGRTATGMAWESIVEPYSLRLHADSGLQPLQVTVTVSWGARPSQRVDLRSIEFAAVR